MKLNQYTKAIMAALIAGYAMFEFAYEPVIVDGDVVEAAGVITRVELARIVGAVIAALGIVWGVPNVAVEKLKTRYAQGTDKQQFPAGQSERAQ